MGECWKLRTVIIKMKTLQKKIKEAFSSRKKPSIFLDPGKATSIDDDVKDVLWFCDKNVEFISLKDWNLHHGAFYAFNSEAFIYFLPNVLILSLGEDGDGLIPAGSFLDMLDRSPRIATAFRQSSQYQQWKALLHHFYDPFPTVEYFSTLFER